MTQVVRIWMVVAICMGLISCDQMPEGAAGYRSDAANPRVIFNGKGTWHKVLLVHELDAIVHSVEQSMGASFSRARAIRVVLIDDAEAFESITGESRQARSGFAGDVIYLLGPYGDRDQVIHAMEWNLTRMLLREKMGWWRARWMLPIWFETGFSLMQSSGGASEEWVKDEDAIKHVSWGRAIIPVGFRGNDSSEEATVPKMLRPMFNTQSRLFVEHLKNQNEGAFHQVMQGILRQEEFPLLWRQYYGQTLDQLWQDYIDDVCKANPSGNQEWCNARHAQ